MSEDLAGRVAALVDRLAPLFEADGVRFELLGVRGGIVSLHVDTTACTGCASPQEVLESGLERLIIEKVPGVTRVVAL